MYSASRGRLLRRAYLFAERMSADVRRKAARRREWAATWPTTHTRVRQQQSKAAALRLRSVSLAVSPPPSLL